MLDVRQYFQATNPSLTLSIDNEEHRKYYIDFSSVRGGQIIEEMCSNITFFSPDEPTCQLFSGHIGCGKSTELSRMRAELEKEGFHVVYFESSDDLEMGDVDIGDILLAIARRVSESLDALGAPPKLEESKGFRSLLKGAAELLQTEIELSGEASIPGIGTFKGSTEGDFSAEVGVGGLGTVNASNEGLSFVALGIGKISAKVKESPELRSKLREYLGPRTASLLDVINNELLEPAKAQLKAHGKAGLAVIVDNLDRVETIPKPWGRPQPEYLFVDRGEQLSQLNCHVIYTIPLSLLFSNDLNRLTSRFGTDPTVLPMVPVQHRDGRPCEEGLVLLRQMILARAFPNLSPEERLAQLTEVFENQETLDHLCQISGGHVRELLRLLNDWIKKQRKFPLTREVLDKVVRLRCNQMVNAIDDEEWALLRQVEATQRVSGGEAYQVLVRSLFVFEYHVEDESWFAVNPILRSSPQLQEG
ncbi:MAG: AAA family ATPase [Spirulina sp. SIO3F2]|nr:AAA family ATPase [Spirulina sp. SIO3F2]